MKINSYCFQKNNIWYFKKRIPNSLNNKNIIYRVSFKKLLGKKAYYNTLLNGTIYTVSNYINNNIELLFVKVDKLNLEELNKYVISLLRRYKDNAVMIENDYINNINSKQEKIENKRFDALSYHDHNGRKFSGHTKEALTNELDKLFEAFDTENIQLIKNKAQDILLRQDIISKEEIEKIPNGLILDFEKGLIKTEIDVINQDLDNYNKFRKSKTVISVEEYLEKNPSFKDDLFYFKQRKDNSDNWELLIDKFIDSKQKKGRKTRTAEIALKQFSQIMMGNPMLKVDRRNIIDCNLDDINYLKEIYKELPQLRAKVLKDKFRMDGILYTMAFVQESKTLYPKNLLGGLQVKLKVIIEFLNDIKFYEPEKYGNLNIDLWKRLHIRFDELSKNDQSYNNENKKQHLDSKYLNEFLLRRYSEKDEVTIGQAKKNFSIHTTSSPHIFWSFALGLFTGARAEELAQIRLRDFAKITIENESIYYINLQITDNEKQSLKNSSSNRTIPISKYLIGWGFLNYVQQRINEKADYLFELKINKDGKRNMFQRNFNDDIKIYIKKYQKEYTGRLPSFHDLRSHFVSKFLSGKNDDTNKLIDLKRLIGHSKNDLHKDVTVSVYFREPIDIKSAKDLIDNMDFKIDLGYKYICEMMNEKYNNIILEDLKL